MAEGNCCPHCYTGKLYYNTAFRRRFMAMASEIGNPTKIAWNVISPLFKNAAGIKTVRKDYTCSECEKMAYACPHCDRWAKLYETPKQGATIECGHCDGKSVFRLD
jgi:hypothetical protein